MNSIKSLSNRLLRTVIDLSNLNTNLLNNNLVLNERNFNNYKKIENGIPLLIPANKDIFIFKKKDIFKIKKKKLSSIIYNHNDLHYVGYKTSFGVNNKFLSKFLIKKKYIKFINFIDKENKKSQQKINLLIKKHKKIAAFQTRNIPHFGHEEIIKMMLKKCNHVVINPVVGPKKKNDIKIEKLSEIFNKIIKKKFDNKISFIPIYTNMYYAGPREAVHHSKIREKLGFSYFSVGRDHAGAENKYNPISAIQNLRKLKKKFKIKIITHEGSQFCVNCKIAVIKNKCNHNKKHLLDISGSNFRKSILSGEKFKYADRKMQKYLIHKRSEIFN